MKNFALFLISIISAVIALSAVAAHADTYNIPDDYETIQAGIDASSDADTVLVQPGTYYENINFNGKNIVLGSLFITTQDTSYISKTVIDGNENGDVVTFENSENSSVNLKGFKIINGDYGIYCNASNPTLTNLIVSNNRKRGIYLYNSSPPNFCIILIVPVLFFHIKGVLIIISYSNPNFNVACSDLIVASLQSG